MNIGIDIDGVLTNDDDYILDFTSKYCYENNLNGFDNANLYEYRKLNWDKKTINSYREEYFLNYVKNEPARKFASEVIQKLRADGNKIFIYIIIFISNTKCSFLRTFYNITIKYYIFSPIVYI